MNIVCPSCSLANTFESGEQITCGGCHKSFAGHTYKKYKKSFFSGTAALIVGVLGGYQADQWLSDSSRYPLAMEYAILNSCINSSNSVASHVRTAKKQEVCLCALENTMSDIDYAQASGNEQKFASRFRAYVQECS